MKLVDVVPAKPRNSKLSVTLLRIPLTINNTTILPQNMLMLNESTCIDSMIVWAKLQNMTRRIIESRMERHNSLSALKINSPLSDIKIIVDEANNGHVMSMPMSKSPSLMMMKGKYISR